MSGWLPPLWWGSVLAVASRAAEWALVAIAGTLIALPLALQDLDDAPERRVMVTKHSVILSMMALVSFTTSPRTVRCGSLHWRRSVSFSLLCWRCRGDGLPA